MSKTSRWLVFLALPALTCLGLTPSRAQDAAPPNVTIVRPTDNGYDDLIQAGDASIDNASTPAGKVIADAESATATLTQKRAAAREPAFRNALTMFRAAMVKPIAPPTTNRFDASFAGSESMQRLARLLAIEQTVLLADGKVAAALDSFSDGLALGDFAQRTNLTGLLIGDFIKSVTIGPLSRHLDELSVRDCEHLLSLLRTEMSTAGPAVVGIHAEGEMNARYLTAGLNHSASATNEQRETFADGSTVADPDGLSIPEIRGLAQMQKQDPKGWFALLAATSRLANAQYDQMADRLTDYPAVPQGPVVSGSGSDIDRLAAKCLHQLAVMPPPVGLQYKLIDKEVISRACLQLLAVHAAILRWRWENNVVPDNLAVLKLGALATDPFTGGTLLYTHVDNRNYTLEAAGPPQRDDNGAVVPGGKRVPVTVPYPKPKP